MATMAVDTVPVVLASSVETPQQDAAEQVPVPPQYTAARVQDFRFAGFAPKGYKQNAVKSGSSKRKLDEYQAQVDRDEAEMQDAEPTEKPTFKKLKQTKEDVSGVGKVSGKQWKEAGDRAGGLRSQNVSSTWNEKMRIKAETKIFRENRAAIIEARKAKLRRARQQRNEAKARKAEGQRKNTKVQQITNPNTLKKMMKDKKQRKKLMTADPENAAKGHA